MFVNDLGIIATKFIEVMGFVLKTVKFLHNYNEEGLLYFGVRLKKTIIYLDKIYSRCRHLYQCLGCKYY